MTDRDALIKELQHMVDTGEWGAGTMRKAIQALSGPGDAEREELAKWCEHSAESELANPLNSNYVKTRLSQQYFRIAQLLRRPVVPVVSDEMVERFMDKGYGTRWRTEWPKQSREAECVKVRECLEAALNVSQPGVK